MGQELPKRLISEPIYARKAQDRSAVKAGLKFHSNSHSAYSSKGMDVSFSGLLFYKEEAAIGLLAKQEARLLCCIMRRHDSMQGTI